MRRLLILFLLPVLAGPWRAEAESITLAGALDEALANRPFVQAAKAQAEADHAAAGEAQSRYLPRLTLSETFLVTDEPGGSLFVSLNQEDLVLSASADPYNFPPSRRDFETRLTLEQPLYDSDIAYGARRARIGAAASRALADWSRQQAGFAVFAAYLEVQRASAALEWARGGVREAAEIARLAAAAEAAGTGLKADRLRTEAFEGDARRALVGAENDLRLARRGLALAMGRPTGEVDISAPLDETPFAAAGGKGAARADLAALDLRREEAALAYRQSRAAYLPKAALAASYGLHDDALPFGAEAGSWVVRAGLNWELFDGLRRGRARARTEAQLRAVQAGYLEAHRQAAYDLEAAQLRAAEARLHLVSAGLSEAAAQEARRLMLARFEAGLSDLSALLSAQSALDRARFDAVQAESRLLLALGRAALEEGTFLTTLQSLEEGLQ